MLAAIAAVATGAIMLYGSYKKAQAAKEDLDAVMANKNAAQQSYQSLNSLKQEYETLAQKANRTAEE